MTGKYILTGGLVGPWRKTKMSKISNVFEVTVTMDPDTRSITVNDITAAELYNVIASGNRIKTNLTLDGASISLFTYISGQIIEGTNTTYTFWMDQPETKMVSEPLGSEDTVVFIPAN